MPRPARGVGDGAGNGDENEDPQFAQAPRPLAEWKDGGALPPLWQTQILRGCAFAFPDGEGAGSTTCVTVNGGTTPATAPAPVLIATGAPYHVRLQLFDDGTCGIAINGKPLARTPSPVPLDGPMRVWIWGNSLGTQIAVGKMTISRGVPGDIDWSTLAPPPSP